MNGKYHFFLSWLKWNCFRVTLGVLGVRLVETISFTTFKETVCSGEVRRNDAQTTKKVWQPLKDHSPPKISKRFFFPTHVTAPRNDTQKQISADGVHREERLGLRRSWPFAVWEFFVFVICVGPNGVKLGYTPEIWHSYLNRFPTIIFGIHVSFRGCSMTSIVTISISLEVLTPSCNNDGFQWVSFWVMILERNNLAETKSPAFYSLHIWMVYLKPNKDPFFVCFQWVFWGNNNTHRPICGIRLTHLLLAADGHFGLKIFGASKKATLLGVENRWRRARNAGGEGGRWMVIIEWWRFFVETKFGNQWHTSPKLTSSLWKWIVGRWNVLLGFFLSKRPIFRGKLIVYRSVQSREFPPKQSNWIISGKNYHLVRYWSKSVILQWSIHTHTLYVYIYIYLFIYIWYH